MSDLPLPGHLWVIPNILLELIDHAVKKAREMRKARRYDRRKRIGATLRPGKDTPMWDELRRALRESVRVRGEQVKLARVLGLPRQQVNSFLTRGTRMPDAERTLLLLAWLIRFGSDTPKLASAWMEGRSLLAGDSERPMTDHTLNRLQAGSYKQAKKQRAWRVGVGLVKCLGACPEDLYCSRLLSSRGAQSAPWRSSWIASSFAEASEDTSSPAAAGSSQ